MPAPQTHSQTPGRLRVIFMGTAPLSCASLAALMEWRTAEIQAVVTQPDRPKGRDLKLQPSPVKELALRLGLPVLQPERARAENFIEEVRQREPDLVAVAAYGQILSPSLLEVPKFGCVNVHTSLLPKYRGAAPIQWALLNDEPETGITIMKMDAGLDTGDIISQEVTAITESDTAETLHDRLAAMGAKLLVQTLPGFVEGSIRPRPQLESQASYAAKIKKEDGHLRWDQPARALWNRVRALVPWPGAFTFLPDQAKPALLKIWKAEIAEASGKPGEVLRADKEGIIVGCGQNALRILSLQREGGRRLEPREFLTGHPLRPGMHLA